MRRVLLAAGIALALGSGVTAAAAQVPNGGYYSGGVYYAPSTASDPYWPTNSETAYDYGVYAVAPGFGPYLRLGGESGWNPNIGTTITRTRWQLLHRLRSAVHSRRLSLRLPGAGYRTWPAGSLGFCRPGYPYCY